MKPLDAYQVVDFSEGPAGGLATMILADFGARVVKVERPGGDPFRSHPASCLWLRGKQSVVWDRADAAAGERLRRFIVDSADVLVTSLPDDEVLQWGLARAQLTALRPDLVVCDISTFGRNNAFSALAQHEGLVAAKAGRMWSFRGQLPREGPVFSAVNVATHAASQSAAAAIVAALWKRETTGHGTAVATSLLRGLLPYEMGGLFALQLEARDGKTTEVPDPWVSMPSINYHAAQGADGRWMQFGNLLPHLLARFFATTGLDELLTTPEHRQPPLTWSSTTLEKFRDTMLRHMQTRPVAEWMQRFVADGGVVAHGYQTTQESLDDPDLVANGHVVSRPGTQKRQLGLVARLTGTPGEASWDVPPAGSNTLDELPAKQVRVTPLVETNAPRANAAPLAGITVVEFATIIAAPLGVASLADLGARVIKVEPLEGDPFRGMAGGLGAARCNAGKESIQLDLKTSEAQQIAQDLVARADVLIHNYRPGVPEKLGIGWETLHRRCPELVYVSVNGYGPEGPGALRPSTHPIPGAALGGVLYQLGGAPPPVRATATELRETARQLFRANELNPDPNTSMVVATAATLALLAAKRSGQGQQVFVDMFGASAYSNFDDFFDYPGKPERRLPDSGLHGLSALYRLYRCRSGWVFLAAEMPGEEAALRDAVAALGHPIGEIADLERVFLTADAAVWEHNLVTRGVGCVQADAALPARFLLDDPLARSEGLVVEAGHRVWGTHLRHAPVARFEQTAPVARIEQTAPLGGACVAGEHTRTLLAELGRSAREIDDLLARRVVAAMETAHPQAGGTQNAVRG